jgi:hypothetical protein
MDRALRLLPFSSPLKRFYKFLLKKVLGNFLQYDLDMHQLDVQLAKGEIELRDLEINVQVSLRRPSAATSARVPSSDAAGRMLGCMRVVFGRTR